MYIVGKLWNPKAFHNPSLIKDELLSTLRNLNLTYLDLYVIQCPEGENINDTWHEMEKLIDNFIVKSIGVSNFNEQQITHLLTSARCNWVKKNEKFGTYYDGIILSTGTPVTCQFDCHPYLTQTKLSEFCRSKNIAVTVYNPFGSSTLLEDPQVNWTTKILMIWSLKSKLYFLIPIKLWLEKNLSVSKF